MGYSPLQQAWQNDCWSGRDGASGKLRGEPSPGVRGRAAVTASSMAGSDGCARLSLVMYWLISSSRR